MNKEQKHITLYRNGLIIGFIYGKGIEISFKYGQKAFRLYDKNKYVHNTTIFFKESKIISQREIKLFL